mgnify:CR=1 FL=1
MYYPLCLNGADILPLFGDFLKGVPYIFDFSSNNPKNLEYNLFDFEEFEEFYSKRGTIIIITYFHYYL